MQEIAPKLVCTNLYYTNSYVLFALFCHEENFKLMKALVGLKMSAFSVYCPMTSVNSNPYGKTADILSVY